MTQKEIKKLQQRNKENKHDRLVGIAMSLIEGVFEPREERNIDGEEYYELEDEQIVQFDPFILDVISRNLIDNAIKYTPENGHIFISFTKGQDYDQLTIRDTGAGMSEIQSERILNNKGSRRLKSQITDSFGLGLIMAKEILERHQGKLAIKSQLGKGTSFIINLPK